MSGARHVRRRLGFLLALGYLAVACGGPPPAQVDGLPTIAARDERARQPVQAADVVWQLDGGEAKLRLPTGIAVDGQGQVYVVDAGNDRIRSFASTGEPLAAWGSSGRAAGRFQFSLPAMGALGSLPGEDGLLVGGGVAVDAQGDVYVADALNGRIQRFDSRGHLLAIWGSDDETGRHLVRPMGLAVDAAGALYVADQGHDRIVKLAADGRVLLQWGESGTAAGELRYPMAVAVGRQGQVYVADSGNARVQEFDQAGRFLRAWGGPGTAEGEFGGAVFLAVDGQGRVYVADYLNHRVQVFSSDGVFLTQWGRWGSGDGEFAYPGGVAIDAQGDIYVADIGHGRIQKFRLRAPWPAKPYTTPTPRPAVLTPAPTALPLLIPTDR